MTKSDIFTTKLNFISFIIEGGNDFFPQLGRKWSDYLPIKGFLIWMFIKFAISVKLTLGQLGLVGPNCPNICHTRLEGVEKLL